MEIEELANNRKVWQRQNSPNKPDDPIIDMVVYKCPVRQEICWALVDRWGNYWAAANWEVGKKTHYRSHGNIYHEEFDGGLAGITFDIQNRIIRAVNCERGTQEMDEGALALTFTDCLSIIENNWTTHNDQYELPIVRHFEGHQLTQFVLMTAPDIEAGPGSPRYETLRKLWIAVFEANYPVLRNQVHTHHDQSVRVARSRHVVACKRKASRTTKRAEHKIAEELDAEYAIFGLKELRDPAIKQSHELAVAK